MALSLWQLLGDYNITIPIIQRDYAQGRKIGKAPAIRKRFLNAIFESLGEPEATLELDFIYGYTIKNKENTDATFIPLDGQQRLTTLFLLHWYCALEEDIDIKDRARLLRFSYETRHSSRVFCENLINFSTTDLTEEISKTIVNQHWFFATWKNDPTISAMLVMLDSIQEMFKAHPTRNIWQLLTADNPKVVFHMLPMEELGLPDDLYIKMNSRGKELTDFEYFKSRFSEILTHSQATVFNAKIDQIWSDLFWNLFKDEINQDLAKLADEAFLRFFNYITDIIIAKENISVLNPTDEFEKYKLIYSIDKNVEFLFTILNLFYDLQKSNSDFFDSIFYIEPENFNQNKTRIFFQSPTIDLFEKCSKSYNSQLRNNPFSIGEQLLLFACIIHLINNTQGFNDRIRKVRNLILNSDDTVRKENLHFLLAAISDIIIDNKLDVDFKFSTRQIEEEIAKNTFTDQFPALKESLNKAEDHSLLQGCIAILNLNKQLDQYVDSFYSLFHDSCDFTLIAKVLLTIGDYAQQFREGVWRIGNQKASTWQQLFSPSNRRDGFDNTKNTLLALLDKLVLMPSRQLQSMLNDYLGFFDIDKTKPKDWKYYILKYDSFRIWNNEFSDGFYYWPDFENKPYEFLMMMRFQFNGRHWSPFLLTLKESYSNQVRLEDYGAPLIVNKGNSSLKITNLNIGYKIEVLNEESLAMIQNIRNLNLLNGNDIFEIKQDSNGFDIEDRVEKGMELISKII